MLAQGKRRGFTANADPRYEAAKTLLPRLQRAHHEKIVLHEVPHRCGWHAKYGSYLFAVVNADDGERCLYCAPPLSLRDTEWQQEIDVLCEEDEVRALGTEEVALQV